MRSERIDGIASFIDMINLVASPKNDGLGNPPVIMDGMCAARIVCNFSAN